MSGPNPFPSVADVTYLLVFFPLMVIGMEGLARSRLREVNRSSLLDALIVTSVMPKPGGGDPGRQPPFPAGRGDPDRT